MNGRDRALFDRIDGVIREIGMLDPPNSADIEAKVRNLRVAVSAAKQVTRAISARRVEDWDEMDDALTLAEQVVAR